MPWTEYQVQLPYLLYAATHTSPINRIENSDDDKTGSDTSETPSRTFISSIRFRAQQILFSSFFPATDGECNRLPQGRKLVTSVETGEGFEMVKIASERRYWARRYREIHGSMRYIEKGKSELFSTLQTAT